MPQLLKLTTIQKWIKDYTRQKYLPNETNSVTIDLEKIKDFISYIDGQNLQIERDNIQIDAKNIQIQRQNANLPVRDQKKLEPHKPKINAIRFYLTRQNNISEKNVVAGIVNDNLNITDDETRALTVAERRMTLFFDNNFNPQTQISLLGLPVLNYNTSNKPNIATVRNLVRFREAPAIGQWWTGEDYKPDINQVHCLYARDISSEHTGLCPYNCDGTDS